MPLTSRPTVSVVVPSYNHGDYLEHALACLVSQERRPDQLIAINDGSSDETSQIIRHYKTLYHFIEEIENPVNTGAANVARQGIAAVKSDFYCGVGADDPLRPDFLKQAMGMLEQYPQAGLCCGEYLAKPSREEPFMVTVDLGKEPRYFSPGDFRQLLTERLELSLPTCTMVWKKSALHEAGGILPELEWHFDWFAAIVIAARYGFCYLPGVYQEVALDENSYSMRGARDWRHWREVIYAIIDTLERPQYNDIKEVFRLPGVLTKFGPLVLSVLFDHPKGNEYLSDALIRNIIYYTIDQNQYYIERRNDSIQGNNLTGTARSLLQGFARLYAMEALFFQSFGDYSRAGEFSLRAQMLDTSSTQSASTDPATRFIDHWPGLGGWDIVPYLRDLEILPGGFRVAIYGAGGFGQRLRAKLIAQRPDIELIGFIDAERRESINGVPVYSPSGLKQISKRVDVILVATMYRSEVLRKLRSNKVTKLCYVDYDRLNLGYGE